MILVDTSIWIDHLHHAEAALVALLGDDEAWSHPAVIEELALGSIKGRAEVLSLIGALRRFPTVSHSEALAMVDRHVLWGRGLSAADVHLLGSVALVPGSSLWTRDKRLLAACHDVGVTAFTG